MSSNLYSLLPTPTPPAFALDLTYRVFRSWNHLIHGSSPPTLTSTTYHGPHDGTASASITRSRTCSPSPSSCSASFHSCFGPGDGYEQEVKILEDNLDQSILREEENLHIDGAGSGPDDLEALKKSLKEQRLRADVEIEQLRKKLADVEMKNTRTTHDLNKEISELESLVEAKIYREDELEQEVERLKEKIGKLERKKSKSSIGPEAVVGEGAHRESSTLTTTSHVSNSSFSSENGVDVCEICEKPGHDIFNCDLLKEDGPLSAKSITSAAHKAINGDREEELDVWCEDCEGHGHTAENCPNAEDVF
ncbi:hypothetical protein V5O48_010841 [Marasmius crinis-equi]|uniref:CLIP1 zinc knuckle domain-containing protein n=1 Tax=Marasmius crinis-equi TaxID=585013 RepID=A0ABR3F765_9AGAR